MAIKKAGNVIALELDHFEAKIKDFQDYIKARPLKRMESIVDDMSKEISDQLKIVQALPPLLEQLKRLRENEEKQIETRGNAELGGMASKFIKDK